MFEFGMVLKIKKSSERSMRLLFDIYWIMVLIAYVSWRLVVFLERIQ